MLPLGCLYPMYPAVRYRRFSHPYEFELERFQPADWALEPCTEPLAPPPAEQTPVTMVSTVPALQQLVSDLSKCREVAVDLEVRLIVALSPARLIDAAALDGWIILCIMIGFVRALRLRMSYCAYNLGVRCYMLLFSVALGG